VSDVDRARHWLRENGYADVADLIDEVVKEWKTAEKRTRRNWWELLAGDSNGKPRRIGERVFPVLKAAQVRQGMHVTPNALSRSEEREPPPPLRVTKRWPKKPKMRGATAGDSKGRKRSS
jgi:hypothetical protein